jgi:hypothetical protein
MFEGNLVTLSAQKVENCGCPQIVTKTGAKRAKTQQIQETEIVAISRLGKGI